MVNRCTKGSLTGMTESWVPVGLGGSFIGIGGWVRWCCSDGGVGWS